MSIGPCIGWRYARRLDPRATILCCAALLGAPAAAWAAPPVAVEGLAAVEAEDADARLARGGWAWRPARRPAGAVGSALAAVPDRGARARPARGAELRYRLRFAAPGRYRLWLRASGVRGGRAVHAGLDGRLLASARDLRAPLGGWRWTRGRGAALTVRRAGVHTLHLWMAEDGVAIDRIVLAADPGFRPAGVGPPASRRGPAPALPAPEPAPPAPAPPGGEAPAPPADLPAGAPVGVVDRLPGPGAAGVGVGAQVFARFSGPVDPTSLTGATVSLAPSAGGEPLPAAVAPAEDDRAVTLAPASALAPGTGYTVELRGVRDRAGGPVGPTSWSFTTVPAPAVTELLPSPGATAVGVGVGILARFSQAIDPASLTQETVRLIPSGGGEPVPAAVAPAEGGLAVTLVPAGDLLAGTTYTVTLGAGVRAAAGPALAAPHSWSFTTGPAPPRGAAIARDGLVVVEAEDFDAKAARGDRDWLAGRSPAGFAGSGALQAAPDAGAGSSGDVAATGAELAYCVRFAEPGTYRLWLRALAPNTSGNSAHAGLDGAVQAGADAISTNAFGGWTWMSRTVAGPAAALEVPSAGEHTVHVWMREDGLHLDRLLLTADPGLVPSGNGPPASPREGGPDALPPVVVARSPAPGFAAAPADGHVAVTFSEALDAATATSASVTLEPEAGGSPLAATVSTSSDGATVTLRTDAVLAPGTRYRATVAPALRDRAGNALAGPVSWTFATRSPERFEPPDGRVLSGASTRFLEEEIDGYLQASGQPSIAIHNRYSRNFGTFGSLLSTLEGRAFAGMISWAIVGNAYSATAPGRRHASVAGGDVDEYILDRAAEVAAYGRPLFLRLHWEMNGDDFSWSVRDTAGAVKPGNSHADFRDSWRRAVILFRGGTRQQIDARLAAAGLPALRSARASAPSADNVAWVWTPASKSPHVADDVHAYWPGDDYVDWAGVDWYPPGEDDAGVHLLRAGVGGGPNELYDRYSGPASASSKPFMIGEWGVKGLDRPAWAADMLAWIAARPQVRAQLYFNVAAADGTSRLQDFPGSAEVVRAGLAGDRWIREGAALAGEAPAP